MSTNIFTKGKQRNILLIGPSTTTTAFIRNFNQFWKCFDVEHSELKGFLYSLCDRTKEITRNYSTMHDEQLCFLDTPQSMKFFEVRNIYEILTDLNGIDVILVFANNYLQDFDLCMQKFFTAGNYPCEKVIFIIYKKYDVNITVSMINLEEKLKKLNLATKITTNKNLFVEPDVFTTNGMLSFCNRLNELFKGPPCGFAFNNIPDVIKVISDVFLMLIEVLHNTTNITKSDNRILIFGPKRWTICKKCTTREVIKVCHNNCDCLDKSQSEDLLNCCTFNMKACRQCGCSIQEHESFKYYTRGPGYYKSRECIELEQITILHMLATFYLFCKESNQLPDVCNLKKGYWSLVRLCNIISLDPVYKKIEDKVKELESNSNPPTLEEVMFLIESLEKEKWQSFQMTNFIKATCDLKLITHNNVPSSQANQKPPRFPEMKTKLSNNGDEKALEDLNIALQHLRKEVSMLKLAMNKAKSEKECMQAQIDALMRKIEDLLKK